MTAFLGIEQLGDGDGNSEDDEHEQQGEATSHQQLPDRQIHRLALVLTLRNRIDWFLPCPYSHWLYRLLPSPLPVEQLAPLLNSYCNFHQIY